MSNDSNNVYFSGVRFIGKPCLGIKCYIASFEPQRYYGGGQKKVFARDPTFGGSCFPK